MIEGKRLEKLSYDKIIPNEKVGFHDIHQGKEHTSCDIQGNNSVTFTFVKLKYCDMANCRQVEVVAGFSRRELH